MRQYPRQPRTYERMIKMNDFTVSIIIFVACVVFLLVFKWNCKSEKRQLQWHHEQLIGFKEDKIKERDEKIASLKAQLEVKDTIIAELSKMNNLTTDKLWEMNGVLLNKATERKCRDVK